MGIREVLQGAAGRVLVDEEGGEQRVALQPPATPARLAEIERELGFALPRELREALTFSAGLELMESVDLASIGPCPLPGLLGAVVILATDGAGNYWILELAPGREALGPVWFLCHDAPVLVHQSPDLATFLGDYLRFHTLPHDGPLADVVNRAVRAVATQLDPPRAALLSSPDPGLRAFAESLEEGWFVCDLRQATPGRGMPLGRFGPRTPLARAGDTFLFAYGSRTRWQRLRTWFTGR